MKYQCIGNRVTHNYSRHSHIVDTLHMHINIGNTQLNFDRGMKNFMCLAPPLLRNTLQELLAR